MTRGGAQTSRGEKRENVLFVVLIYESNDIAEIYWQGDLPALTTTISDSPTQKRSKMQIFTRCSWFDWHNELLEILTQLRLNNYLQLLCFIDTGK